MRLELLLNLEKSIIPRDYKKICISYLKNALTDYANGKFYEQFFGNINQKDYAFSVILSKPKFNTETIELENNRIKLLFTASDTYRTGLIFFAAFIHQKNKRFPLPEGNAMTLKRINQVNEQLITESRVIFKTTIGGGLAIRQHDRETNTDRYFTFQDEGFDEQMKLVLGVQAREAGFPEQIAQDIDMRPIQCKKVVVKHYGVFIDLSVGIFKMEGNAELLQYFYQAGLGSKRSQGFGMVDIIAQN